MKSVYVLDDSGAYRRWHGGRVPEAGGDQGHQGAWPRPAGPEGGRLHGVLTKIKSLNPDAIYYGGVTQAGVKLAKQAYDIIPKVIKGGGDGMMRSDLLTGAGFPAVEGWYATHRRRRI